MSIRTRRIKRAAVLNGDVEKLDHMIDHSIARRKTYKPSKRISNEKALFEMIDTRIGHMLAKSCELEAKLDSIEKKNPNRKTTNAPIDKTTKFSSSDRYSKAKYTSSFAETVPKLVSPSKVLSPELPSRPTNNKSVESLFSLIQNLANEISEMHEEQKILKNQIEKMQECLFSAE